MKTWGELLLLDAGCALAALVVVLLADMLKLPISNKTIPDSLSTVRSTDDSAIDESLNKPSIKIISPRDETAVSVGRNSLAANTVVADTSFELKPSTARPVWQPSQLGADHIAEWTTEQAATGQHALKITATQPSGRGWPGWHAQFTHKGNDGYRVEAKYYTNDGANAWLELSFLDSDNRLLTSFSTGCPRSSIIGRWTSVQHQVNTHSIPRQSRSIRVGLRQCLNHSKGRRTTLYFDDFSLHRVPDSVSQ